MQCHTAFGKMPLPPARCCCAKQADSKLVLLQIHLWGFALHTGVHRFNTSGVPHCFWRNAFLTAQCCCVKQADSRLVPLQIHLQRFIQVCSGPTPVECHTAFGKMPLPPAHCCSAKQADSRLMLLQIHLWGFLQVCSGPTTVQCHTAFGKMHSSLLSAAVQNRLTAGLCCCKYTYGDLLFIQVCSGPTPVECHTAFGKMHSSLLSAAVQNRQKAGLCHCKYTYRHSYRCAVVQHQWSATLILAKCIPHC